MNTYRILLLGLALFIGFLFSQSHPKSMSSEKKSQPNVLFVAFDDLNDWESVLAGHPQALTPNFDRLAEQGILFTNAHAAGTMCNPSRASVITGLRPTTTGVYRNNDTPIDLYKTKQTLNKHFKDNGYFVAGAGKILHKFYYEKKDWDEFVGRHKSEGIITNRENPDTANITKLRGSSLTWGPFYAPDSITFDAKSVEWVSERINRKHDKPFFLACGIYRPHIPWFNPQQYFDMHPLNEIKLPLVKENDLDDVPLIGKNIAFSTTNFTKANDLNNSKHNTEHETFKEDGQWEEAIQAYLASVSYADAQFGKLLDALENSPYANNTIIVLWSDHGWHLGEKEHWRKGTLWEEVTRVPLIISARGMQVGKRSKEAVSLIDIFPTLIELCGLPEIASLEGESLVPQLREPNTPREMPAISSIGPEYHAVRDEQFRYITYGNGQEELYDHNQDPNEWSNIADNPKYAEVKQKLKRYIPKNGKAPTLGVYNN